MHRISALTLAVAVSLGLSACGDDADVAVDEPVTTVDVDDADFATLDANGDSYLDVDEVAEWADDAGVFSAWDADADSELDPDEITGNAFELWDADANGTVSQEEWETGADLWYPNEAEPIVFSDLDNDGDSEVDRDEFAEHVDLSPLGESWTADSFDEQTFSTAYFELYDQDNNGQVSELEWTTGAAAVGIPN